MRRVSIELDDHVWLLPERIDHQPADGRVDLWERESLRLAEGKEALLEHAPRERELRPVTNERRAQGGAAGHAASRLALDGVEGDEAAVLGLGERAPEGVKGRLGRHVEQRLGDRCHGQPGVPRPLDVAPTMDHNAWRRLATTTSAQVDPHGLVLPDSPPPGGGGVAEHPTRAGVEEGGCEPPFRGHRSMTHGVDARVEAVQPALLQPSGNRHSAHSDALELAADNDPPLALGQRGHRKFVPWRTTGVRNSPNLAHPGQDSGRLATAGASP